MDRLSKEQWLDHGLAQLAQSGFTVLKADKLAKSLGVSRGSFYWHFKDIADFHAAVLERWREVAVNAVIIDIEQQDLPAEVKLRRLINIAVGRTGALEQAMRAWAFSDSVVNETVATIDAQRLAYIQTLLQALGLNEATAITRSYVIYCSYLGRRLLSHPLLAEQQAALIEELIDMAVIA
ncbi:MAG: hypothetical protein GFH27_549293n157 [Chloroflexi bacterium AL-W]|nr:hypothetical protein [Chloroflexi bacterium AL-N1]NOK67728.1 hypothetical protein [Chloroflexi bacterium AL-N10]NOK75502.1 hypothetical protein [Chloroflexi bacterium AL-N5]NOK82290.1 hypothetical protein [Chloroflexi bacterium AL-W]NOK90135.1 hypothetical protein [Chloroflexi bacterium AL-N15]